MRRCALLFLLFLVLLSPLSCGDEEDAKPAGWPCSDNADCKSEHCVKDVEGRGVCI